MHDQTRSLRLSAAIVMFSVLGSCVATRHTPSPAVVRFVTQFPDTPSIAELDSLLTAFVAAHRHCAFRSLASRAALSARTPCLGNITIEEVDTCVTSWHGQTRSCSEPPRFLWIYLHDARGHSYMATATHTEHWSLTSLKCIACEPQSP